MIYPLQRVNPEAADPALSRAPGPPPRGARRPLLLSLALAIAACGGDGGAPAARDGGQGGGPDGGVQSDASCHDYTTFDAGLPVDFRAEVLPILQRSCATGSGCHASRSSLPEQPYLGPTAATPAAEVGDAELAAIREQNVNADAAEAPGMKRVAPGDPERSFLMHKIDGTLRCEVVPCDEGCGLAMPPIAKRLPPAERDMIRRWIAHGAVIE